MNTNEPNKNMSTSLQFKTRNEKKGKSRKRIAALFIAAVLLVAAVSVLVVLIENDFKLENVISSFNPSAETTQPESTVTPLLAGRVNFLLVCSDNDSKSLRYTALLCADLNTPSLHMYMLSPDETVTADNYTGTLNDHFLYAGMPQLVRAVEEHTARSVERYIKATDASFKDAVQLFGGLEYNVPSRAICELDGVSFTIESGLQTLTPDMLMRYMTYLGTGSTGDSGTLCSILCAMIDSVLTQTNFDDGERLFKKLSNYFETDISAMDFTNYNTEIHEFIINENRLPAQQAVSLEGF